MKRQKFLFQTRVTPVAIRWEPWIWSSLSLTLRIRNLQNQLWSQRTQTSNLKSTQMVRVFSRSSSLAKMSSLSRTSSMLSKVELAGKELLNWSTVRFQRNLFVLSVKTLWIILCWEQMASATRKERLFNGWKQTETLLSQSNQWPLRTWKRMNRSKLA